MSGELEILNLSQNEPSTLTKALQLLIAFTLSFFSLVLISIIFGLYYETGSDITAKALNKGWFNDGSEGLNKCVGLFIYISDLISLLYKQFPRIEWFDLSMICIGAFVPVNVFLLNANNILGERKLNQAIAFGIALLLISFSVVILDTTRLSLILCCTSILVFLHSDRGALGVKTYSIVLIAIALLIRVESGLLSIALLAVLHLFFRQYRWKVGKLLAVLVLPVLALLWRINTPLSPEESQYLDIRPYQFTLWDYNHEHQNLQLHSLRDSIKYITAKDHFIADYEEISAAFFQSIGLQPADKHPTDFMTYIKEARLEKLVVFSSQIAQRHWLLLLAYSSLLVILLWFRPLSKFILVNLCFFLGCLATIAIYMKMVDRVFIPLLCLSFLILLFEGCRRNHLNFGHLALIGSLLIAYSIVEFKTYYGQSIGQHQRITNLKNHLYQLDEVSVGIVLLNPLISWNHKLFDDTDASCNMELTSIDNAYLFAHESHKKRLKRLFGAESFEDIAASLTNNHAQILIISSQKRAELISTYFREVYQTNIQIESIYADQLPSEEHSDLNIYSVSSVSQFNEN